MAGQHELPWNVPYKRNRYFTGHEETLRRLHQALNTLDAVSLTQAQGLSGLGGIGKTQIAVEFAYRYRAEYDAVLWVRADSLVALTSSFSQIARLLRLPESQEQDQRLIVEAVLRWLLLHTRWLLICDDLDDFSLARPFLPKAGAGHIIFTTRASALAGIAERLEIARMDQDTGAFLLLRRAELLPLQARLSMASQQERDLAGQISLALDGLPLALDQAGAYIKETPTTLATYLQLYQARRAELLSIRGSENQEYPASVATTWSLSFEKVTQANPAATDLLTLCAFLAPDVIPETIFTRGASHLGDRLGPVAADPLQFDLACREARRFSLIARAGNDETLTMHRLVQEILRANTPHKKRSGWRLIAPARLQQQAVTTRREWEQRAVLAVEAAAPDVRDVETWPECEVWVPHALVCADWIAQEHFSDASSANLLNKAGFYLDDRSRYQEAESLYQQCLVICRRRIGPLHPDTAQELNNLGALYQRQGKYTQAERLHIQALAIRERALGVNHASVSNSMNNLGMLYLEWGKYTQAERMLKRSLAIREQLSPTAANTATAINNLALLFRDQGKYDEAEAFFQRGLALLEKASGPTHPETAGALKDLADLYRLQGKYAQAVPLAQRALAISEQRVGAAHPLTARNLISLAALYQDQGKYALAGPLILRALKIYEDRFGQDHPETALCLNNLGVLYMDQGRYSEAEQALEHALTIRRELLDANHPQIAQSLINLAGLAGHQGKFQKKEQLLRQAQAISRHDFQQNHPDIAANLNSQAALLYARGEYKEAEPLYLRALAIREQQFGLAHPDIAQSFNNLAELYAVQGQYAKAETFHRKALALYQRLLGPDHPDTARSLNNLAGLYHAQGKYQEAEPLLLQSLAIRQQQLGPDHPDLAQALGNLGALYAQMRREAEAEHYYQRSLTICEKTMADHPDLAFPLSNLAVLYMTQQRYREAEPLLKRALAIRDRHLGSNHPDTLDTLCDLKALADLRGS